MNNKKNKSRKNSKKIKNKRSKKGGHLEFDNNRFKEGEYSTYLMNDNIKECVQKKIGNKIGTYDINDESFELFNLRRSELLNLLKECNPNIDNNTSNIGIKKAFKIIDGNVTDNRANNCREDNCDNLTRILRNDKKLHIENVNNNNNNNNNTNNFNINTCSEEQCLDESHPCSQMEAAKDICNSYNKNNKNNFDINSCTEEQCFDESHPCSQMEAAKDICNSFKKNNSNNFDINTCTEEQCNTPEHPCSQLENAKNVCQKFSILKDRRNTINSKRTEASKKAAEAASLRKQANNKVEKEKQNFIEESKKRFLEEGPENLVFEIIQDNNNLGAPQNPTFNGEDLLIKITYKNLVSTAALQGGQREGQILFSENKFKFVTEDQKMNFSVYDNDGNKEINMDLSIKDILNQVGVDNVENIQDGIKISNFNIQLVGTLNMNFTITNKSCQINKDNFKNFTCHQENNNSEYVESNNIVKMRENADQANQNSITLKQEANNLQSELNLSGGRRTKKNYKKSKKKFRGGYNVHAYGVSYPQSHGVAIGDRFVGPNLGPYPNATGMQTGGRIRKSNKKKNNKKSRKN